MKCSRFHTPFGPRRSSRNTFAFFFSFLFLFCFLSLLHRLPFRRFSFLPSSDSSSALFLLRRRSSSLRRSGSVSVSLRTQRPVVTQNLGRPWFPSYRVPTEFSFSRTHSRSWDPDNIFHFWQRLHRTLWWYRRIYKTTVLRTLSHRIFLSRFSFIISYSRLFLPFSPLLIRFHVILLLPFIRMPPAAVAFLSSNRFYFQVRVGLILFIRFLL